MKKLLFVISLAAFLTGCPACYASSGSSTMTAMGMNGEDWNNITRVDPTGFVRLNVIRGFFEGAWYANQKFFLSAYYCTIPYETIRAALDKFYSVNANIKVPIGDALQVIAGERK